MAPSSVLKLRWKREMEEGNGPAETPPQAERAPGSTVPIAPENQLALANNDSGVEIARAFVTEVMETCMARNDTLMCNKFVRLVTDLRDRGVDIDEATTCITELFQGTYSNLIMAYNEFMQRITQREGDPQAITLPEEDPLDQRQQAITLSEEDRDKRHQTITLPEENPDKRQPPITLKRKERNWEEGSQTKTDNRGFEECQSRKVSQRIANRRQLSSNDGGRAARSLEPERVPKGIANKRLSLSNDGGKAVGSSKSKRVLSERIANKRLSPSKWSNDGSIAVGSPHPERVSTSPKRPMQAWKDHNIKGKGARLSSPPPLEQPTMAELMERLNKCRPRREETVVEYTDFNWYKE